MKENVASKIFTKIVKFSDWPKPSIVPDYSDVESVCEQRSILNEPRQLYEQFVQSPLGSDVMEELESEKASDFDNDFYEYEDRAEYGEDVALAASLPPIKSKKVDA